MADQKPPPSAHERKALIAKRKTDIPTPAPAPRPRGVSAAHAERVTRWEQHKKTFNREKRIQEIDQALNKSRGVSKSGFERAR